MVAALMGVGLLYRWKEIGFKTIIFYIIIAGSAFTFLLSQLGVFDAVGASVTVKSAGQIVQTISSDTRYAQEYLAEIVFASVLAVLFFVLWRRNKEKESNEHSLILVVGALVGVWTCFIVVTLIDVHDIHQTFRPSWIVVPLICFALMSLEVCNRNERIPESK